MSLASCTRTHVSLFAGIGAMDLAAEHAGYRTTACVEVDGFCREVLALRFPDATLLGDVREVSGEQLLDLSGGRVDLMSVGFPCQDLSSAGKGAGLSGERSGLWFESLRLIEETRPDIVLIENVAVLRSRGLDVVIDGLARAGYGCWWDCVPALAVGAPHLRDRVWVTAAPYELMPKISGRPFRATTTKMPRAGASTAMGLVEMKPAATIKACKAAMGAIKRDDGVTWLDSVDNSLLFPTPSASSYGSNRGGAAGRSSGGKGHSGTTLSDHVRIWPTPTSHPRTHTPRPVHHGAQLANEVMGAAQRVFPTPRSRDWKGPEIPTNGNHTTVDSLPAVARLWPTATTRDGSSGPGRSSKREGGDDLRTAVSEASRGSLSPDWVCWLMGLPVGWDDLECAEPKQLDWLSEHGIHRVATGVARRKDRLKALGNSLVWQVAWTRIDQALIALNEGRL